MSDGVSEPSTHLPAHTADLTSKDAVVAEVRKALSEIEFGSIVIKIHQGRVVGMETSTKLRLDR